MRKQYERGGFYAVVPLKLYDDLLNLAQIYHGQIDVVPVLAPQLLGQERQQEINAYHASRIADSKKLAEQRELTEAQERKFIEQCEHAKRRANTLAAVRQKEFERLGKYDLRDGSLANADHESQYKWDHWVRTQQMTGWYI